jgi:hypothetical protein
MASFSDPVCTSHFSNVVAVFYLFSNFSNRSLLTSRRLHLTNEDEHGVNMNLINILLHLTNLNLDRAVMGVGITPVGVASLIGPPITGAILGSNLVWWKGVTFASVSFWRLDLTEFSLMLSIGCVDISFWY